MENSGQLVTKSSQICLLTLNNGLDKLYLFKFTRKRLIKDNLFSIFRTFSELFRNNDLSIHYDFDVLVNLYRKLCQESIISKCIDVSFWDRYWDYKCSGMCHKYV